MMRKQKVKILKFKKSGQKFFALKMSFSINFPHDQSQPFYTQAMAVDAGGSHGSVIKPWNLAFTAFLS